MAKKVRTPLENMVTLAQKYDTNNQLSPTEVAILILRAMGEDDAEVGKFAQRLLLQGATWEVQTCGTLSPLVNELLTAVSDYLDERGWMFENGAWRHYTTPRKVAS